MAISKASLEGKVVAITGGARGIGRATAAAFVARGARVAIGDIDGELAADTARRLGRDTLALTLDVTDTASFSRFLVQVEERVGPLDVLVNNAGIMPLGAFAEADDATARRVVDINLVGVIVGTKLAMTRMVPRRSGHIVNIASQAGKVGLPGAATYCATKFAVVGLCEALRMEFRGTGVLLSCVMPAVVNTELGAGVSAVRGSKLLEPEDVADAIVRAVETGAFEVYVPKQMKAVVAVSSLLPRGARDLVAKVLGADRALSDVDRSARAAYEQRAAAGNDLGRSFTSPSSGRSDTRGPQ